MSRASIYYYTRNEQTPITETLQYDLSTPSWFEMQDMQVEFTSTIEPTFDLCYFSDRRARLVAASLYLIAKHLEQQVSTMRQLTPTTSLNKTNLALLLPEKRDTFEPMPPLSARKAVMKARYAGSGEPLGILVNDQKTE